MAKKILMIEDSKTDAAIVKELLEKEGFRVEVAVDGESGVRKAREMRPDLVVLDLMLPDIDGYEVCGRLREDENSRNAIIVILSVKDDVADITKAFHSGADDYIIKPPIPEFLIRKIKLYLGLR